MYNRTNFYQQFSKTEIYSEICKDYDFVLFDKHFVDVNLSLLDSQSATPRQQMADRALKKTYFSAVPFYYLKFLTEKNPTTIYDLGCGWNIFKKYYSNIIGVGPEDPQHEFYNADINDYVDKHFVDTHQNYFESVFSIDALHYHPLSDIKNIVLDFYSMIAPGGRGWLALNAARLVENDTNFIEKPTEFIEQYIKEQLETLPESVLLLDIDLSCADNWMDGNIQIIFEKNH